MILGLALALVITPSLYSDAFADSATICSDETISTGTFTSITVVSGTSCTITGDVIITGNFNATGANDVIIDGTPKITIGGNILIKNSLGEININNVNIDGKVTINNNSGDSIFITSNSIGKNFVMKNNEARDELPIMDRIIIIDENIINGNLRLENNFAENDFFVRTNIINGNVTQTGTEVENNDIAYEKNIINGNLNFKENHTTGEIDFIDNEVYGSVNIIKNIFDQVIYFDGNHVGGKLLVTDNGIMSTNINIGSNILKNVTIENNLSRLGIFLNTFDGTLKITQNTNGVTAILNSFTSGDLIITNNNSGLIQFFSNSGSKNIIIKNNISNFNFGIVQNIALDKIIIQDNIVGNDVIIADLICHDNLPAPIGSGNAVSGIKTDQCSLL